MKRVSNVQTLAKFLLLIFASRAAIVEDCDFCDSRWRKVFEIDDQGNHVSGSYDELLAAAKQAEPIKYLIPSLGVEGYAGNCDLTFTHPMFVYFLSMSYVSKSSWKTFEEEPYHRLLGLTTSGYIMETRYLVNNFMEIKHTNYKAGIQWFVKSSSCTSLLLDHSGNGTITNGSLDSLISSLVSGHDVTVTWLDMFTEPCRNIKVDEDGIVVGQFVWDVMFKQSPDWSFMNVYTSGKFVNNKFFPGETYVTRSKMMMAGRWYADSCWEHVFTNDENGDGVDGSLYNLICAANRGHRVKVLIGNFSIEADNVRKKSGQISAQLLNRLYAENVDGKSRGFWYWQMAHTTGTVATLKYRLFNGTSVGEETEKKTIKWFVDSKPWKNVLTTNEDGDVVFGSKADLRSAVENGADVRVALHVVQTKPASNTPTKIQVACWEMGGQGGCLWHRNGGPCGRKGKPGGGHGESVECKEQKWTVFKTSNLELGPSGEVSAELLQSVSTEEMGSKEFKIEKDAFWKYMVVSTEGDVDIFQSGIGVHKKESHFSVKHAIKWFVNY